MKSRLPSSPLFLPQKKDTGKRERKQQHKNRDDDDDDDGTLVFLVVIFLARDRAVFDHP